MRAALVAGEPSGDLLGATLLQALKTGWPNLQAYGVGGSHMQKQGFDILWAYDPLSVHGYMDALKNLPQIWRLRQAIYKRLLANPPDIFIGIDAPDFNLGLERKLKARGVPTLHFISPSIWAWRGGRIRSIAQSVDHMLCVFPFEKPLYDQARITASFVGHPLATQIPFSVDTIAAKQALGLQPDFPVLALLPGSRRAEIERITPRFLAALQIIVQRIPQLQIVLPAVPKFYDTLAQMLTNNPDNNPAHTRVQLLRGQSHAALAACDLTLIASGTATLEAMLFKKPMVIAYLTSPFSAMLMRRMGYLPWVGLPNILAGKTLVPEFLQERATSQALAQAVVEGFSNPQVTRHLVQQFTQLHHMLLADTVPQICAAVQRLVQQPQTSAAA